MQSNCVTLNVAGKIATAERATVIKDTFMDQWRNRLIVSSDRELASRLRLVERGDIDPGDPVYGVALPRSTPATRA
jgi:hypothetical protein